MWWIIPLAVILLITGLAFLPVGVRLIYDQNGFTVKLLIWFFPYKLNMKQISTNYWERRKKYRRKVIEDPECQPETLKPDGTLREFIPLLNLGLQLLFNKKHKLYVNLLELKLTMVNDDPFDLAMNYGRAWAIINGLLPQLERIFNIKKRRLDVNCDFLADEAMIYTRIDLLIPLVHLIAALVAFVDAENKK